MTELRVEGLVFDYPDGTRAVDGVDLVIPAGQRLAIVGRNGSGKSTLIRHLNGLLRPTTGRVLHDGADTRDVRVARLAGTVAIAFQDPDSQIFASTVRAEVAFGPRNLGVHGRALDEVVDAALAAVGLQGEQRTNPYDLGYSRRKLLGLAGVLAMGSPVVVLDEPNTGQDARGVERVERIVEGLVVEGRTVIAVTHDMRFVAAGFERVVVMRSGRVVADGVPASVFGPDLVATLASTFLVPPLPARVGARLGLGGTPTDEALLAALRR